MAFVFLLGVALFISVWASAKCDGVPQGVELMECRDRFFVIAVDLSCIRSEPHFEAVDDTGVYPITKQYAAECGYSVNALTVLGHMELQASYFSCHAENKDDKMFTFNFNLVATHDGEEVRYALNKTCSPSLPWSPREVTCEINYMEVSVRSDVACPTGAKRDWDAVVQTAHFSATSDWQVMFQKPEQEPVPMSLSETHRRGYVFQLTDGRLVFRTPYGQPDSFITVVDGIPVEVVHATLFSRQSWVVLLVNMEAACSMHEGSFDESTHMRWQAPEVLNPLVSDLHNTQVNIGVNGKLVEQSVAEERGYIVEKHNNTIQISIPYTAEGGYRKSFVIEDLYQFYIFNLYLEKISVDEDHVETRFHYYRTLSTPLMLCPIFTVNRMDLEQRLFIVYLGDVPEDVELVAIHFNGHEFTVPLNNTSIHMITNIHSNNTHGYTLKVPFDDPVIIHEILREESVMKHKLDIYYTLTILPENEHFNYLASVTALTYVSSPVFDAVCSESGISFKLDHQPFHYLWEISIGSDLLTSELAAQHGYIMSNSSQSLLLHVPLFTHGYQYKNVTLKEYFGTFEILLRDHETSEIQSSTVKTCPFNTTTELIVCSTDGRMTVVADLSPVVSSGVIPARTSLIREHCGPIEADNTRVLFSFPLHTCGSIIKLGKNSVTYKNKISFSKKQTPAISSNNDIDSVTVQCTYPLAGLHRLFSAYRFESDTAGVGCIVHSAHSTDDLQSPTVLQTPVPSTRCNFQDLFKY